MDDRHIKWIGALAALGGLYLLFGRRGREMRVGAFTRRERGNLRGSEQDWDKPAPAVGFEPRVEVSRFGHHERRSVHPFWRAERVETVPRRRLYSARPERHYYPAQRARTQEVYWPEVDIQLSPPSMYSPAPPPVYAPPTYMPAPPPAYAPAPPPAYAPTYAPTYTPEVPPLAPPVYPAPVDAGSMPYEPAFAADVPAHGIAPLPPPPPHVQPSPYVPPHAPAAHPAAAHPPMAHPMAPPPVPPVPAAANDVSVPSPAGGGQLPLTPWWQNPPLLADQQHMAPDVRGAFEAMSHESQQSLAWQSLTTGHSMEEILRSGG